MPPFRLLVLTPSAPADPRSARMSDGRWAATATRLHDGRVLVAGGYSFSKKNTLRSADLWDPKTRRFMPAAPMNTDRNFATATRLANGKVLVAGGFSETRGTWDTAELYDFRTDAWTPTRGRMNDRRELYTATALPGGKVLLVGGLSLKKRTTLSTAEWYDPLTDTFTPTRGKLREDRFGHAAALLPDGKVLIVGGKSWRVGQADRTLASAEVYDPLTDTFRAAGPLKTGRDRPTATPLRDGRILVAGGAGAGGVAARIAEIYDFRTGAFTDAAALLAEGRMAHDAVALSDGRIVAAGGWSDARKATTATVEVYDPRTNHWSAGPSLPFHSHDLVLIPLSENYIFAVGGKSTTGDDKTAVSIDISALLRIK